MARDNFKPFALAPKPQAAILTEAEKKARQEAIDRHNRKPQADRERYVNPDDGHAGKPWMFRV